MRKNVMWAKVNFKQNVFEGIETSVYGLNIYK